MLGRQSGGWDPETINPVNPLAETPTEMGVATGVEVLTAEALQKSGFSEKDANGALAITAAGYAAYILMAQLREAKLLPEGELATESFNALLLTQNAMRERLGLPEAEPMSEETHEHLLGILKGEVRRPEQG